MGNVYKMTLNLFLIVQCSEGLIYKRVCKLLIIVEHMYRYVLTKLVIHECRRF